MTLPETLFDQPCKSKMAERFEAFNREHPEVYEAYCKVADQLWQAGCRRFGSQGVFWVVRWKYAVNPDKRDGFKIPNGYSPHYARKYLADHPSRNGFFETRELKV